MDQWQGTMDHTVDKRSDVAQRSQKTRELLEEAKRRKRVLPIHWNRAVQLIIPLSGIAGSTEEQCDDTRKRSAAEQSSPCTHEGRFPNRSRPSPFAHIEIKATTLPIPWQKPALPAPPRHRDPDECVGSDRERHRSFHSNTLGLSILPSRYR